MTQRLLAELGTEPRGPPGRGNAHEVSEPSVQMENEWKSEELAICVLATAATDPACPGPTQRGGGSEDQKTGAGPSGIVCTGTTPWSLGMELSHVWVHQGLPQKLGLGTNQIRNVGGRRHAP